MHPATRTVWASALAIMALVSAPRAQGPAAPQPAAPAPTAAPETQTPRSDQVIRSRVDLVTTDVIVRDGSGQFVADLKKEDFEVYEDGVQQELVSFTLTHGGRIFNVEAPPPATAEEGIILPAARPTNDAAGRIFLVFVDDLHLDFRNTPRIRQLFQKIAKELIHEGDMFGIVSTGPSSIAVDMTYDRRRLDEAMKKISGAGLAPKDILDVPQGQQGPPEVRYRAHVAFSTAYDIMQKLQQVQNRRKAVIYVSNGYDFNPFATTRAKNERERYGLPNTGNGDGSGSDEYNPFLSERQSNVFHEADLAMELSELTRAANRANASFYTIDPRGLVGMPDLDENIDMVEWQDHVRSSQDSLRVLAEQTGGIAVVNQNDFDKALKRIDNETSDYYVVGYYSSNPDPTKRRRRIEIKLKRANLNLRYRTEYSLKAPPRPAR
ncbi:MAG TPA: VWA domain-containing protein [Vicinamibacterales bacterium]|nr:VWA domain-containing protein [Vicinamibacterales bacterium]